MQAVALSNQAAARAYCFLMAVWGQESPEI
jgi:hypothetical protein